MSEKAYDAALDLLRRLDATRLQEHLQSVIKLEPELAEELLSSVDTPLVTKKDPKGSQREYLCCDYNRDIDSHRSPWSNEYFPELSAEELAESPFPSESLRQLEVLANDSFDIYRDLYYEGGVSSVYLWDVEEEVEQKGGQDFAGVVLFKKGDESSSCWDSIHVLEATRGENDDEFTYRITTTIILHLGGSEMTLSGNLTRQTERTAPVPSGQVALEKVHIAHITNLGSLIEDVESQMRNLLESVYFDRTRDIFHEVRRSSAITAQQKLNKDAQEDVIKGIQSL